MIFSIDATLCQNKHRCVDVSTTPALDCAAVLAIDVGKDALSVYNGIKNFRIKTVELHKILELRPNKVYLEPSGIYHRPITRFLLQHNVDVFFVNTLKFKQYRDQITPDFKTDDADARTMYDYVHRFPEATFQVKTTGHELEPLLRRRHILTANINRWARLLETSQIDGDTYNIEFLQNLLNNERKQLRKLEKTLEKKLPVKLRECFGITLTATLLTYNPQKFLNSKKWTSYFGFKLKTYESGTIKKQRHITKKGNSEVRRLLYLRVMTLLSQKKEPYTTYFRKHKIKSGIGMKAMVATMRKLLKHFWALHSQISS